MVRRVLPPDQRRAELLDAAREVFISHGYHRASVGLIVREVGCARGTFYNYFENKRAVFTAVVSLMMDEVVGVIHPIDVTTDIPLQVRNNLERIVRAVLAQGVAKVLFGEALGVDDEGDHALRAFYEDAVGRIELALRTGQALGVVARGDTQVLAWCLLGLIKEPVFQARLRGEDIDVESLVEQIIALLTRGVLAR
jgi:AcrR family transcriptional regulator